MSTNDLDCVIFVDGDLSAEEFVRALCDLSGGTADDGTIVAPFGEIDVLSNPDFESREREAFPKGFLRFTYRVEVYPHEVGAEAAKEFVAGALSHLWASGVPAVAACDYEDELPAAGGRADPDLPWPSASEPHAETEEHAG